MQQSVTNRAARQERSASPPVETSADNSNLDGGGTMKTIDEFLSELRQLDVKVWVDGDRLRYRAAKDALTPALLAQLRERKAEIIKFLHQANAVAGSQLPPIAPVPRDGKLPLSFAQQRLWFLHQFEPDSSSNNMPVVVRLTGSLNVAVLEQSLAEVVRRHEILRTTFPLVDGQPCQVIAPTSPLSLPIIDFRDTPPDQREAEAHKIATKAAREPFDLAQGPILRLHLLRLADEEHLLLWNMHCIVCDGASSDVFYQDLTAIYTAFSAGKPLPLPELPVQYVDFAQWQRQWIQGEVLESQLKYWKQKLEGDLPLIQLPTDYQRPPSVQTYRGDRGALMLPIALNNALTTLSQKLGGTLFMTLLAVFEILLYRYSGQEDILISFASAGRGQVETEQLIGFFSNTLVLRTNFEGNPTFRELLERVRKSSLEAYAHQDVPFEKLIEELRPEQSQSRSPLFQVKFALNPPWSNGRGMASVNLPDLTFTSLFGYIYHGKTKYDLTLVMREQDEGLGMVFDYNADLFAPSTIARMLGHFQTLLEGIVANPDQRISDLPLLTAAEQHQLLVEWKDTQTSDRKEACIHQLFESQAEQTPDAVAVVFENQQLTYRELNARANQLAHYLRTLEVKPEVLVGICMERSPEAIVGLLGILKAGGAYVPLDPAYPQEHLALILENAQVSVLLTQQPLVEKLTAGQAHVVCLDTDWEPIQRESQENPTSIETADNLAYVMYDSGTTDKLKPVSIIHRGVVRLAKDAKYANLTAEEIFLQLAPISGDASTFEIWGCLLNGGRLVIFPAQKPSLDQLGQIIQQHQITTLWFPTRLFHQMVDEQLEALKPVRQLLTGGDTLSVPHVQKFLQKLGDCKLINVYSLTENTTLTCCYLITEPAKLDLCVPIGRPIANTQVYLLDNHLQPVPVGVPGQLYIGGDSLSRGYLNCPDLTEEKFIPNSFSDEPGARLYKTGALVRYLPDGNIEFLGHIEDRVKTRGLYLELSKIEAIIRQHPAVRESVVIVHEDSLSHNNLVAYVVPNQEQEIKASELRSFLKQKLPNYLVPSTFVLLDSLPLTLDGKLDRHSLPESDPINQQSEETFVASRDDLELQLTKIWEEVLDIQPIGITDKFFDLGGHSLLAVRLFAQIEKTFNKNLPLAILLQAPTIEQLATILRQQEGSVPWSPLVTIQSGGSKPPLFCIHGGGFNVLVYRELAINLGPDQPVYGLQARGLDGSNEPLRNRIEEIATDYVEQILTVQPEGPYFLAGLSSGGNIALEMAQQLHAQGQKVALLAMFDSYGPDGIKLLPPIPRLLSSLYYASRYSVPRWITKFPELEPGTVLSKVLTKVRASQSRSDEHSDQATVKPVKVERSTDDIQHLQTNVRNFERCLNHVSQFILNHSPWAFLSPKAQLQGMEGSLAHTLKKLEDTYSKAYKTYEPKAYPGCITLFQAGQFPPGFHVDSQLGWGKIATGGLEIYRVSGHHTSIMKSPVLAEKFRLCIDKALANTPQVLC